MKHCFISMLGTKSDADFVLFGCGKNLISGRNRGLASVALALGGGDLMESKILGSCCFK